MDKWVEMWGSYRPKLSISISIHRQIYLYKEIPITYNPSAKHASDLHSLSLCLLRSAIAP